MKEKNFTLTLENLNSPVIITVPHGGMKNSYATWLEAFFQKRVKSENPEINCIKGEKIVTGGDNQILHLVSDVLKAYKANAVIGLLPRSMVDYNRFIPEVAYSDKNLKIFYDAYHKAIEETIEKLLTKYKIVTLLDFHGFGQQPIIGREFDIILGTNGESSPRGMDKFLFSYFKELDYKVFCAGVDGMPKKESELYNGDTTNLYYHKKYGIEGLLVEISPKFRSAKITDSKKDGKLLSTHLVSFLQTLEEKTKDL